MTNWTTEVKGSGNYGACHVMYSKFLKRDGTPPIAIIHHEHQGSADNAISPIASPGLYGVAEYLVQFGYICVFGDFRGFGGSGGSAQWGNDDNQAGIDEAKQFGVSYGGSASKPILGVGLSMGVCCLLGYAGRYPGRVAGVVGILPAIDIAAYKSPGTLGPFASDGVTPSPPFTTIDAAYGGNYSNGVYGPTHNPRVQADAGAFNNLPIQLWYGDADNYAPFNLVYAFVAAVKRQSASAPITLNRLPGNGLLHDEYSATFVPKTYMLSFAQSCVS